MYIHVYCKHVHIVEVTQFSASTSACSAQHCGVSESHLSYVEPRLHVHVHVVGLEVHVRVRVHEKGLSWWGQTSQRSLDSGCFELVSSHQQGIRITCLTHHPALYTQGKPECCSSELISLMYSTLATVHVYMYM